MKLLHFEYALRQHHGSLEKILAGTAIFILLLQVPESLGLLLALLCIFLLLLQSLCSLSLLSLAQHINLVKEALYHLSTIHSTLTARLQLGQCTLDLGKQLSHVTQVGRLRGQHLDIFVACIDCGAQAIALRSAGCQSLIEQLNLLVGSFLVQREVHLELLVLFVNFLSIELVLAHLHEALARDRQLLHLHVLVDYRH